MSFDPGNVRGYFILDPNGIPIPCFDLMEWARWFETAERRVAVDERDGYKVSTVFLGLDHSFGGADPILYETMIFAPYDGGGDMWRYSTRYDAKANHEAVVQALWAELDQHAATTAPILTKVLARAQARIEEAAAPVAQAALDKAKAGG